MTDFVIRITNTDDALFDPATNPRPAPSVRNGAWSGFVSYLYTSDDVDPLPAWPGSGAILGAWNEPDGLQYGESYDTDGTTVIGTPTYPIQQDYWDHVAVLGNDNRKATGPIRSVKWAGHSEEKYAVTDQDEYPLSDDPFVLTIARTDTAYPEWDSGTTYAIGENVMHLGQGYQSQQSGNLNHEPGAPGSGPWWAVTEFGHGWIATMVEPSDSQDPITNYNIRAYPDPNCTPGTQTYTSGNFTDVGGGVFQTETPSGNLTATEEQINIALIFVGGGNTQNGILTMEIGESEVTKQFWSHDQP